MCGCWVPFLMFTLFTGGPRKHRPKEPKKKTKQRLRFWAQNQHSDHLASARNSQWGTNLPTSHWWKKRNRKKQSKAASRCCCKYILTDLDSPEPPEITPPPALQTITIEKNKTCIISESAYYTHASRLLLLVPSLWSASGSPSPAPYLALWTLSLTEHTSHH